MKERPILFGASMVRALLDGSKTQTRRVFKAKNGDVWPNKNDLPGMHQILRNCPYGQPGDRLWVRETTHRRPMLHLLTGEPLDPKYDGGAYTADSRDVLNPDGFDLSWWYSRKTCPAIHMPRWASRILLEIVSVRVERLQDISEVDAVAEGVTMTRYGCHEHRYPDASCITAQQAYRTLWNSINGGGSWDANPWVWVVEFKRVTP